MGLVCNKVSDFNCNPCSAFQNCYRCESSDGGANVTTKCRTESDLFFAMVILPLWLTSAILGIASILLRRKREAAPNSSVLDGNGWSLCIMWVITTIIFWGDVHFWVMVVSGPPDRILGFLIGGIIFIIVFICVMICLCSLCLRNPQPTVVVQVAAPRSNNTVVVMGHPQAQPGMIAMQQPYGYPAGYAAGYPAGYPAGYAQPVYLAQGVAPGGYAQAAPYQPASSGGYPPEGPSQGYPQAASSGGGGEGDVYA